MSDNRKVTHVTVNKHYDDGTVETQKVQPVVVASILAAGLAVAPQSSGRNTNNTYLNADECPIHGPWKAVQGGVSKNTGKPYRAFWTCDVAQGEPRCTNKPSHEWEETHPPERTGQGTSSSPASSASDFDSLPF